MANVLGRGLDALFSGNTEGTPRSRIDVVSNAPLPEKPQQEYTPRSGPQQASERPKESVFWIETEKIKPNPEQPRTNFDEEKIRALAESIRQYGMLQPIVVSKREIDVPTGTQVEYQIIAGERRYRAACIIGLAHVPAIIRHEESDKIKLELALIENLQREDLNPMEKAYAYKRLINEFHLSAREVGMRVGKSREAVANTVRLLLLPEYIQHALTHGRVMEGQVRPLISISHNMDEQRALFQRILTEGLVARDVEFAARQVLTRIGLAMRQTKKSDKEVFDATTRSFETHLQDVLGTRVSVHRSREGKGKISIEFFSEAEFQNLMARMASAAAEIGLHTEEENAESSVVIRPPLSDPDESSMQAAARPEDLSTFTV